jgi:hypothetical protein
MSEDDEWELELGGAPLEFGWGARVRAWSRSERTWRVGTVRAVLWVPNQRSEDPAYREVIFDGTDERVTCRASDLRSVPSADAGSPAADDERFFEPGDRVRVRDAQSGVWKAGTVRQVIVAPGDEIADGEHLLRVSYRVAFDDGGAGRFDSRAMEGLDA